MTMRQNLRELFAFDKLIKNIESICILLINVYFANETHSLYIQRYIFYFKTQF